MDKKKTDNEDGAVDGKDGEGATSSSNLSV